MKTQSQEQLSAQNQAVLSQESQEIAALGRDTKDVVKTESGEKVKTNHIVGIQAEAFPSTSQGLYHPAMGMYKINLDNLSLVDYYFMKDYYQIRSAFAIMSFTLQSVNWWIEGGTKEVNDAVTFQIKHLWSDLMRVITKAYWAGFSPAVKLFDIDQKTGYLYIKKLRDLSPFMCKVVPDKDDQSFNGFVQKSGYVSVTDKEGNTTSVHKSAQYIEPKYAFWYSYMMEEGNFYGQKLLKGAYMPWFFSQVIHLYENRYFYRFSTPTVVGKAPSGLVEDADGNQVDAQTIMLDIVKSIRNNSSVSIPSEVDEKGNPIWDVKFLESLARGYDFETYQKRLDKEMSRSLFLPDLLFDTGRVGSYKLGEAHKDTYMMLLNANVNDLKLFIDKYIIKQFVEFNFAPKGGKPVEMPTFAYEKQGTLFQSVISTIVEEMIKGGKVDLDIDKLSQMTGIPMKKAKEVTPEQQPKEDQPKEVTQPKEENKVSDVIRVDYSRVKDSTQMDSLTAYKSEPNFYDEISKVVLAQVGRITSSIELGKDKDFLKLGFRAKLEKIWQKFVSSDVEQLYDQANSLMKEITKHEKTVGNIRDELWKGLSMYYMLTAKKVNPNINLESSQITI